MGGQSLAAMPFAEARNEEEINGVANNFANFEVRQEDEELELNSLRNLKNLPPLVATT